MSADRIVDIAEPVPGAPTAYALAVEFHGAHIGLLGILLVDGSLVGIGAIVMDGAVVGAGSIIGAGALVPPGMEIPPGVLAVGQPARVRRPLNDEETAGLAHSAEIYATLARDYRARGLDQNI